MTTGSVEPLKKLHADWWKRVRFVDVVIRQAHPGPGVPAYHSFAQKLRDAGRYMREENVPWPVLADDVAGTVHQAYGGLADPTYLIGADGRVSYYCMWTHAPSLHDAIGELLARGGSGVVAGGVLRWPHLGASMTDGWRGLQRGLPQSVTDLMAAAPGSPLLPWLGHQARPLLAPLTLRSRPLPPAAKAGLVVAGLAVGYLAARRLAKR